MRNLPPNICKQILALGVLLFVPYLILATGAEAKENASVQPVLGEGPREILGNSPEVNYRSASPAVPAGSELVFCLL